MSELENLKRECREAHARMVHALQELMGTPPGGLLDRGPLDAILQSDDPDKIRLFVDACERATSDYIDLMRRPGVQRHSWAVVRLVTALADRVKNAKDEIEALYETIQEQSEDWLDMKPIGYIHTLNRAINDLVELSSLNEARAFLREVQKKFPK